MNIRYSFLAAAKGLTTNKGRSILTILGIVVGITAIILVIAIGSGAERLIIGQIEGLGSKTIAVIPGREPSGPTDFAEMFGDSLKQRDLEALSKRSNVPTLDKVMPLVLGKRTAIYEGETYRPTIFGGGSLMADIFNLAPSQGRFINENDVRNRGEIAVIGYDVKKELFGDSDALSQKIRIKNRNLKIVGVLSPQGQASLFNLDQAVIIPYTTAQQYIFGIKYFHRIIIEARSEDLLDRTARDIEATLRDSHGITNPDKDDFFVETQADLADRLGVITSILTTFLTMIAAISLIVGGIGIMNIMLVSVSERTQEIGLRKSIGATKSNILTQFLVESIFLTALGGLLGIIAGALLSFLASIILGKVLGINWTFVFPFSAGLIGFAVSMAVGLIFGLYPAWQAAKKDPITALLYE